MTAFGAFWHKSKSENVCIVIGQYLKTHAYVVYRIYYGNYKVITFVG